MQNQHETPRKKIVSENCSYASTTDYGKKDICSLRQPHEKN